MNRGQAAMEFLMTYGWAILVVLVAIGALAYFGVLSPDRFLPERCTGPAGLDCVDKAQIDAPANTVTLALRNNLGFPIHLMDGSAPATECGGGTCNPTATDDCSIDTGLDVANVSLGAAGAYAVPAAGTRIENNDLFQIRFDCDGGGTASLPTGRFKSDLTFWYRHNETGIYHQATTSIRGSS